ncbi:uncharacterized protein METZ01_LOCUS115115 [marine metagenome]|uniref:Uncharacterized protein n=1 Tax=marine metagenome TaxID=408172 RepID=A0A381XCN8_9ZZZZ
MLYMPEGINCVMNTTAMSSSGSTQKAVLAIPPQANSPTEPGTKVIEGFFTTENPNPKPIP